MIALKECALLLSAELLFFGAFISLYLKNKKRWFIAGATVTFCMLVLTLLFFRDPHRTPAIIPYTILSPADGLVVDVENDIHIFEEDEPYTRISIYLSLLDVHVNRAPVTGTVFYHKYTPGLFKPAYSEGAVKQNENVMIGIRTDFGNVYVKQISGILARRIVCRVTIGDSLNIGSKYGMIKFGSRVELYLPKTTHAHCMLGDRVKAGLTVLGMYDE